MVKKICDWILEHKWICMLVLAAIAVALYVIGCDAESATGAMLAMSGAVITNEGGGHTVTGEPLTTDVTREVSPELLENDVYEKVVKVRPSNTPIDTITRKVKREKATSQIVEFYSVGVMPNKSTLTAGVTAQNNANPVIIDVADSVLFDVNDTILVPSITVADGSKLVLYVQKKTDDFKLSVLATNSENNYMPEIASGAEIIRIGFAGSEKDAQCTAMQPLPDKTQNYCQVFEAQCEESEFQKFTGKEVKWNMTDIEEAAVYEMKRRIEYSLLFGAKAKFYDNLKKENVYTAKGMWWQAGSEWSYEKESEFGQETLTSLQQLVFTGNNGAGRRILFGGSDLIAKLQNIPVERIVNDSNEYTKLGIDFSTIVSKFGRLEVVYADVFDQVGMPGCGFVMDPTNVIRKEFKPFTRRVLDLKTSGVRNTDAVFMQEVACLNLLNPSAHCRIVVNE